MKIRSATSSKIFPGRRIWFTAAALLPFLAACSTDDISGLWFGSSEDQTARPADTANSTSAPSASEQTRFNSKACGLFFGQPGRTDETSATGAQSESPEILLERSPQQNLLQAISHDMDGNYESARKLYVWLTASPPDATIDLDCGQGIRLTGSVNSLAQRRLAALDAGLPEFARSAEIETVVASATVAPGPILPDPPKVVRDRRFYQQGKFVSPEPEDRTDAFPQMQMDVSENTARLTRVERRTNAPAASPTTAPVSSAPVTAPAPQETPVAVPKLESREAQPAAVPAAIQPASQITAPEIAPATIAGAAVDSGNTGAVIVPNSRPVEQGELDVIDRVPDTSMVNVPMATNSQTPAPSPAVRRQTQAPRATETAATAATTTAPAPYYAIQLAAYRSRDRAEGAWPKLQSASRGVLADAPHQVMSIAIEGKGLFFRLLTGQFDDRSSAESTCARLKSVGVDCLIRRVTP